MLTQHRIRRILHRREILHGLLQRISMPRFPGRNHGNKLCSDLCCRHSGIAAPHDAAIPFSRFLLRRSFGCILRSFSCHAITGVFCGTPVSTNTLATTSFLPTVLQHHRLHPLCVRILEGRHRLIQFFLVAVVTDADGDLLFFTHQPSSFSDASSAARMTLSMS